MEAAESALSETWYAALILTAALEALFKSTREQLEREEASRDAE